MMNVFIIRNCIIISFILKLTVIVTSDCHRPKLRTRELAPVDKGSKNERILFNKEEWDKTMRTFSLKPDAKPLIKRITKENTINCNGEIVSLDINSLTPVQVLKKGARCSQEGCEVRCGTPTVFEGSTRDGKKLMITLDGEGDVRTIDCEDIHMEKVSPRIMAVMDSEDIDDLENEGDVLYETETPNDRKLLSTLMQQYGNGTSVENKRNERSLSENANPCVESYCAEFEVVTVAIAYDSTFCAAEGGQANANTEVQNIVSRASKAFEQQGVCVRVVIGYIDGHCNESTDPYADGIATDNIGCSARSGEEFLIQKFKKAVLSNNDINAFDAIHLFYNKQLMDTRRTRGCANFFRVCRTAVGVNDMSFNRNEQRRAYLFSHELGHNFGMSHKRNGGGKRYIMKGVPNSDHCYEWHPQDLLDFQYVLGQDSVNCLDTVSNTDTQTPTESPSESPVSSATSFPTPYPTSSPTSSPSEFPSVSPSISPSSSPSASSSESPSTSTVDSVTPSPTTPRSEFPSVSPSTSSPSEYPSVSPSASLATFPMSPSQTDYQLPSCETFMDSEDFTDGWSNSLTESISGFGKILGRFNQKFQETSKSFFVPTLADEIIITFKLIEFDVWEGNENARVVINGNILSLGNFFANGKVNGRTATSDVEWNTAANNGITLTRKSDGVPEQIGGKGNNFDETHTVTVTVPKNVYSELEYTITFGLLFAFRGAINDESGGIYNLEMKACGLSGNTNNEYVDAQCKLTESISVKSFDNVDNTWTNMEISPLGDYGNILGRYNGVGKGTETIFEVPTNTKNAIISFKLFEFDKWDKDDTVKVIINGETELSLGEFNMNTKNDAVQDLAEGEFTTSVDGITLTRKSDGAPTLFGGHVAKYDEIHSVTINVPKSYYADSGEILFRFEFSLIGGFNAKSVGFNQFEIIVKRDCITEK